MFYRNDKAPFLAIGICVIILIVAYFINNAVGANEYNNSICTNCGGTYEFKQAVGHNYGTTYMYICDKCCRVIEIPNYYPPNN